MCTETRLVQPSCRAGVITISQSAAFWSARSLSNSAATRYESIHLEYLGISDNGTVTPADCAVNILRFIIVKSFIFLSLIKQNDFQNWKKNFHFIWNWNNLPPPPPPPPPPNNMGETSEVCAVCLASSCRVAEGTVICHSLWSPLYIAAVMCRVGRRSAACLDRPVSPGDSSGVGTSIRVLFSGRWFGHRGCRTAVTNRLWGTQKMVAYKFIVCVS